VGDLKLLVMERDTTTCFDQGEVGMSSELKWRSEPWTESRTGAEGTTTGGEEVLCLFCGGVANGLVDKMSSVKRFTVEE
jgi:hypothetical protein